jgi:hypothetical protein
LLEYAQGFLENFSMSQTQSLRPLPVDDDTLIMAAEAPASPVIIPEIGTSNA